MYRLIKLAMSWLVCLNMQLLAQSVPENQCSAISLVDSMVEFLNESEKGRDEIRSHAKSLAIKSASSDWMVLKRSFPEVADHLDFELIRGQAQIAQQQQQCQSEQGCQFQTNHLPFRVDKFQQDFGNFINQSSKPTWLGWEAVRRGEQGLDWSNDKQSAGRNQPKLSIPGDVFTDMHAHSDYTGHHTLDIKQSKLTLQWMIEVFGELEIQFQPSSTAIFHTTGDGLGANFHKKTQDYRLIIESWKKQDRLQGKDLKELAVIGIDTARWNRIHQPLTPDDAQAWEEMVVWELSLLWQTRQIQQAHLLLQALELAPLASYAGVNQALGQIKSGLLEQWQVHSDMMTIRIQSLERIQRLSQPISHP